MSVEIGARVRCTEESDWAELHDLGTVIGLDPEPGVFTVMWDRSYEPTTAFLGADGDCVAHWVPVIIRGCVGCHGQRAASCPPC